MLQQNLKGKNDAKDIRELGSLACQQLQAKKSAEAEILCSDKVSSENLGLFFNAFALTNYDWTMKAEDPEPPKEGETDERLQRKVKTIDAFEVHHATEKDESFKRQEVLAEATIFARNLVNQRGSYATPSFMEAAVRNLCEKHG